MEYKWLKINEPITKTESVFTNTLILLLTFVFKHQMLTITHRRVNLNVFTKVFNNLILQLDTILSINNVQVIGMVN